MQEYEKTQRIMTNNSGFQRAKVPPKAKHFLVEGRSQLTSRKESPQSDSINTLRKPTA